MARREIIHSPLYEISPATKSLLPTTRRPGSERIEIVPGLISYPSVDVPETPNLIDAQFRFTVDIMKDPSMRFFDELWTEQASRVITDYFKRLEFVREKNRRGFELIRRIFGRDV